MNVAQAVAGYLRDLGVRRAFGVPGGELVELIEAFRRLDIPFVLTHHEAPAAFMAAATGELSEANGSVVGRRSSVPELLAASRRPLLIAGIGLAAEPDAAEELRALAEAW